MPCLDAADANDDGRVTCDDVIFLIHFLIEIGPQPPAPFDEIGIDPTPDDLICLEPLTSS